ncbi:MAG: hypothetical protein NTU64_03040 [Hyphomicrobiales bacterium]|nr:hypothetical protein [Hyphomicrobiales bacterium]
MPRAGVFGHRRVHFVDQRGIERDLPVSGKIDKALGQIAVLGGQRRFDLAAGQVGVEFFIERARGDFGRIILDAHEILRIEPARHHITGERAQNRGQQHHRHDAMTAHHPALRYRALRQRRFGHGLLPCWRRESLCIPHPSRPLPGPLGITPLCAASSKKTPSIQRGSAASPVTANDR